MRIANIFDVDIRISKFLLLLTAVLIITGYGGKLTAVFLVFCVHEAAHIITARLLGKKVKEIELLPFGGAIHIQSIFELNPAHEIMISLAGPLSNIMLLLGYFGLAQMGWIKEGPRQDFVNINLMLAGFNLLPALPLDGGRILRAALAQTWGINKATRAASWAGVVLAVLVFTAGLYSLLFYRVVYYSLFLLSGFLLYSALKERRTAAYILLRDITYKKESLLKEGSMSIRDIAVLYDLQLKDVVKRFMPHRYHYIQVMDEQFRELGELSESQVINGLLDYGAHIQIGRLLKKKNI